MRSNGQQEILADRLNSEPLIFRGSSSSEMKIIFFSAIVFWVPFSFLIAASFGAPMLGLGFSGLGILASVFFGSTLFQWVKRGRPDHYYQHLVKVKLQDSGFWPAGLIRHSGFWGLGRTFINYE